MELHKRLVIAQVALNLIGWSGLLLRFWLGPESHLGMAANVVALAAFWLVVMSFVYRMGRWGLRMSPRPDSVTEPGRR